MTIEKLIKYCLQYLEQGSETDIMKTSIYDLLDDDTFAEYMKNMEHSIFMGLTRYASSETLKIAEVEFPEDSNTFELTKEYTIPVRNVDGTLSGEYKTVKKPLFHKVKEIYAENKNGDILPSVEYFVIGNKIKIKKYNPEYKYFILYYPIINDLEIYMKNSDLDIYKIELNALGVTDEMAINLKYLIYSELKLEENPNLANTNKNYFETYLESLKATQVFMNQTEMLNNISPDVEAVGYGFSREWRDIYGD